MAFVQIKDGEFTSTIYGLIKDAKYAEAVRVLQHQLQFTPTSRAGLSLLAYCFFYTQEFVGAAECYEKLIELYPDNEEYRLYYAQTLYNAFLFPEAMSAVTQIEGSHHVGSVVKLQAAIKYREDDLQNAKILVEQCPSDDHDTEVNLACLEYKEGNFTAALDRFTAAINLQGYHPDLAYSVALCHYQQKQYSQALKFIAEIIDRGIKDHPELGVGMVTEGMEVRSVGNTLALHETALIEAFNLKAAIEYNLRNYDAAIEALTDMPPRSEEELDPVTLHNQALMNIDKQPSDGFAKMQFLLSQNPFPPETFPNLLLLYCKYEYYDLTADVLAENAHLTYKYLTQYLYDFLDAVITQQTSPDDAFMKFDVIATQQTDELRKLTKRVQEARQSHDDEGVKRTVDAYDEALERYLPVLMGQAKIYWDLTEYGQVEKIFRKSVEFSSEHDMWKLNVAHTLFMQESKFKEAAGFYEPIVKKNFDRILDISAIVLANLCVCYIMTNQNEEAEELMRKVEKEEERVSYDDPDRKSFHLCIINLVIGTLYCSKGNYEFGISRVIKAMEPHQKKLGTDTWFYAKRCLLSTIENLAKHMVVVRDSVLQECLQFLEQCETFGKNIKTTVDGPLLDDQSQTGKNTVTYEARLLRALMFQVMHY
uniref:Tetratricopeptide repeat protein 30 n=1 Tax=Plectus sambesii TaxID=2011161 RepID=A0A914VNJ5_9BILA